MKTKEELNALREELKAMKDKLQSLSEDELAQVTGGKEMIVIPDLDIPNLERRRPPVLGPSVVPFKGELSDK